MLPALAAESSWIAIAALSVAVLMLLILVAVHRHIGATSRREEILDAFSEQAISSYLLRFHLSRMPTSPAGLRPALEGVYDRHSGGRSFFVASVMMVVGVCMGVMFGLTIPEWFGRAASTELPPLASSALAGAYCFVLFDLVGATIRRALATRDLIWAMYRFASVVPIAYAVLAVVPEQFALLVAFSLGAFPTEWLQRLVRRLGHRYLEGSPGSDEAPKGLPIDGLDRHMAEQLADENITNIVQLAYCDPIVVAIRTNQALPTIVDYVNQALLAMCAGEHLAALQKAGIRGSRELVRHGETQGSAGGAALAIAGLDAMVVSNMISQLESNPQAVFVYEMSG